MKKIILACCLLLGLLSYENTFAQTLNYENIEIYKDGQLLKLSGAGGLNAPQYSPIDLNNDGIKDLLVFDRSNNTILTFINNGRANTIDYVFAPEYIGQFPKNVNNFLLARDFNCDGIEDLFFYTYLPTGYAGIQVLKGGYGIDNKIEFTLAKELLTYDFRNFLGSYIFLYNPDIPAIVDIDNDGDLDILAFTLDVAFSRNVFFYKNMSQERGYGCDSLEFVLFNECFGQFSETDVNNTVIFSGNTSECGGNPYWRHVGSTVSSFDHNGDGIEDIVMGDVSINTLNLLTLTNISDTLVVTAQDPLFPFYDTPVDIHTFPAAYFLDVNNDGATDMIAACNSYSYGENVTDSTSWLYLNHSQTANANFFLENKGFMFDEMLDLGYESQPVFVDLNHDGLIDIVVAVSYNAQNNGTINASIAWLKNIGTANAPKYNLEIRDLGNISQLNKTGLHATLADMNNDGEIDMLIGTSDGNLIFYKNEGWANGLPIFTATSISYFDNINANYLGAYLKPQFYDFDNDGDYDLVVGEMNGNLNYFENRGTPNNFIFDDMPNTAQFGQVSLNTINNGRYSNPHFYRDPSTASTAMILGNDFGDMLHFSNIDNNLTGAFTLNSHNFNNIYLGGMNAVSMADINQDNILDLVIGTTRGGLTFYTSNSNNIPDSVTEILAEEKAFVVYPNPSRDIIMLDFKATLSEKTSLNIYNTLGQNIYTETILPFSKKYTLDLSNLPKGVYFLHILNNKFNQTLSIHHKP